MKYKMSQFHVVDANAVCGFHTINFIKPTVVQRTFFNVMPNHTTPSPPHTHIFFNPLPTAKISECVDLMKLKLIFLTVSKHWKKNVYSQDFPKVW